MIEKLRAACDEAGGQAAWADPRGVPRSIVSNVLRGDRLPTPKLLKAMGLKRVWVYREETP